jgi:general secretion pathway protein K
LPVLTVLWGVGLLTIAALSLMSTGNISYQLARNGLEVAAINATAEAVIHRTILGLIDPRRDKAWRSDGVAQNFVFDGQSIKLVIQDELGRIDLNRADTALLAGLFRSAGLSPEGVSGTVDKILDWRDSTPLKHANGAKEQDYHLAGLSYGPRNGPFQSVEELMLVMGMTPALFARVKPALTVYSGRQFIDPQVAPREALLALPEMDAGRVASIIAERTSRPYTGPSSDPAGLQSAMWLAGRAYTIRTEIARPSGIAVREAAIRLTDNPVQPYFMLNWKSVASIQ